MNEKNPMMIIKKMTFCDREKNKVAFFWFIYLRPPTKPKTTFLNPGQTGAIAAVAKIPIAKALAVDPKAENLTCLLGVYAAGLNV